MRTILLAGVIASVALSAGAADLPKPVVIYGGSVLCANNGDLRVFATTGGALMPSCRRLAHDTKADMIGSSDHGIVMIRPPIGSGDSTTWYTLQASLK
jgi:hypothetical protein